MTIPMKLEETRGFFETSLDPTEAAMRSDNSGVRPNRFEAITPEQETPSRTQDSYRQIAMQAKEIGAIALIGLGILLAAGIFVGGLVGLNMLFVTVGLPIGGTVAVTLITAFAVTRLLARCR